MVNRFFTTLLQALLPHQCCLCGLETNTGQPLCSHCYEDLSPNLSPCPRCAVPQTRFNAPPNAPLCGNCQSLEPAYDRALVPWIYDQRLASIIQRWKYQGERRFSPFLAHLWLEGVSLSELPDLIIPTPLHWRRLWSRGFNQSGLLAHALTRDCRQLSGIPVDYRGVLRNRHTPPQWTQTATQRSANLRSAFTASRPYDNLRVAVVDDVMTTGATANAVASVLRSAGAAHIEIWCLARTPAN